MADPREIRRTILSMLYKSGGGHLGCCMSVVEMLLAIYASVDVEKIKQGAPDRDRVVVSKGHCAAAVYAVLAAHGVIERDLLDGYHSDGSPLAGLVSHACPGVELSTGALGHGINVAVGAALGLKRKGIDAKVLTIIGDGEAQEGSVWEAMMFAAHHELTNLTVLVDDNSIGSVTRTERVMRLDLADMFAGFGASVWHIGGHDLYGILAMINGLQWKANAPRVLICKTTKGKGVSFAENEPIWHYRTLNAETYAQAMSELEERVPA